MPDFLWCLLIDTHTISPRDQTSRKMSISIITATYNRSNLLAYAINSVLRSTYEDWELIVVGDACTDDTESVVNAFGDPRIQFYNLEENFGEQSGPNNIGFSQCPAG